MTLVDERAQMSTADINDLPDSAFAYIEPGGSKDSDGKTTPRSLRHYPLQDEAHVRNALSRAAAAIKSGGDPAAIAQKALPKIKAAAKKMGIGEQDSADLAFLMEFRSDEPDDTDERADEPEDCPTCEGKGTIMDGHRKCPDCGGTGEKRSAPTAQDPIVSAALNAAMAAVMKAKAAQAADPDNETDPDDATVNADLEAAGAALSHAIVAQSKDGHADQTPPMRSARRKPRHRSRPLLGNEFRRFSAEGLEVRSGASDGDTITITGSPIVYGVGYEVHDMFGAFEETMHQGVARNAIARKEDVRFLFNHEGMPLARTTSGTLLLKDTPTVLRMEARLSARNNLACDLADAIGRGDVNQMSIGFSVADDEWSTDQSFRDVYLFRNMFDVSAVTYPASPTTSIELAERMALAMPVESRARLHKLTLNLQRELRAGKVLSQANTDQLSSVLDALNAVDLDDLQSSLAAHADSVVGARGTLSSVLNAAAQKSGQDDPDDEGEGDEDGTGGGADSSDPGHVQDGTGSRARLEMMRRRLELSAPA